MATPQKYVNGRLRMNDLQLDLDEHRVLRDGNELKLSRLTFRMMQALAFAAPALVTKDELVDVVWDGRVVSPETVAQRIKLLRQALQDDASEPRYIEVVRGQGYRWIPDVVAEPRERVNGTEFLGRPEAARDIDLAPPQQPSVAVLPFDTLGDSKLDHKIFANGLTHDLITSIGRTRWLFVVARGTAFMFQGSGHSAQDAAEKLGVRYVVQGSVMFSGRRIRINAALADARSGKEIWSDIFDGTATDVFGIMEDVVAAIVATIEVEIDRSEQKRASLRHPDSLDAWTAYHRAWWHLNSFADDAFDQGEHFFNETLRLDPESARANAGLSCVYWLKAFLEVTGDRVGDIQRCLEFGRQSVSLDPRDPLSHWALGRALHLTGDFENSVKELEMSTDLNPNFAFGLFSQAFTMMLLGDHERSNEIIAKARRLSPYDPMSYAKLGIQSLNLALLGDVDRAADVSGRGAGLQAIRCQMFPAISALCNALAGRGRTAADYYRQLLSDRPGYRPDDYFRAFPHRREADVETISQAFAYLRKSYA